MTVTAKATKLRKTGKTTPPGPNSREEVLSRIDRRTRAGRVMRGVEADLANDLGGDPSAAQRLLIQSAAVKATRLALLADHLLDGAEIQSDQHNVLAWANSLRHDLQALGLKRIAKTIGSDPLSDHFSRPYEPTAGAE